MLAACGGGDAPTAIEPPAYRACWSEAEAPRVEEAARRHCAGFGREAQLTAVADWWACGAQGSSHRASFACVPTGPGR